MLRASSQAIGEAIDADAVAADDASAHTVPGGDALIGFVDAVCSSGDRARARAHLAATLGADAVGEAAAVIANFEMMTRVADGTGARLPADSVERMAGMRARLGLDAFPSARH